MNPKYEKICSEIEKAETKIGKLQERLSELYEKKTEMENLEIINTVRTLVMDKDQIMAFLSSMKTSETPSQPSAAAIMNREEMAHE